MFVERSQPNLQHHESLRMFGDCANVPKTFQLARELSIQLSRSEYTESFAQALAYVECMFSNNHHPFRLLTESADSKGSKPVYSLLDAFESLDISHPVSQFDFVPMDRINLPFFRDSLLTELEKNYPDYLAMSAYDLPSKNKLSAFFINHEVIRTRKMSDLFHRFRCKLDGRNNTKTAKNVMQPELAITWNDFGEHEYLAIDILEPVNPGKEISAHTVNRNSLLRIIFHGQQFENTRLARPVIRNELYSTSTDIGLFSLLPVLAHIALEKGFNPFAAVSVSAHGEVIAAPDANSEYGLIDKHAEMIVAREAAKTRPRRGLKDDTVFSICTPCHGCAIVLRQMGIGELNVLLYHSSPWSGIPILADEGLTPDCGDTPYIYPALLPRLKHEALKVFIEANTEKFPGRFNNFIRINIQIIVSELIYEARRRGNLPKDQIWKATHRPPYQEIGTTALIPVSE